MQDNNKVFLKYNENAVKYFTKAKECIEELLNEDAKLIDEVEDNSNFKSKMIKDMIMENSVCIYGMIQNYEEIIDSSQKSVDEYKKGEI